MRKPIHHPTMNKQFGSADEFFGRSVDEYKKWLLANTREQSILLNEEFGWRECVKDFL